jgi:hypothetical protein
MKNVEEEGVECGLRVGFKGVQQESCCWKKKLEPLVQGCACDVTRVLRGRQFIFLEDHAGSIGEVEAGT